MTYNNWRMMDKLDVVVRKVSGNRYDFTGYIVEHGDKRALESAKEWGRVRDYDYEKREYKETVEPDVHTFDNGGFTARIMDSAGGSSQGGRLSFWQCEIEKDGISFKIGVNDSILADLIKNSDIKNGVVQQKVMFARQGGQPGLIHEGMKAYKEAVADMEKKSALKSAKKTKKWELGGVYSTLRNTDVCLGEVWDTLEEYQESERSTYGYMRTATKYRKREKPVKTLAWAHFYNYNGDKKLPESLEEHLKNELKDRTYIYFSTGTPPARSKASQLVVKESDNKLLDKYFALKAEYGSYIREEDRIKGRYVRELNETE